MIWATVSSQSCFCWLYRASPTPLTEKNIINLISVLTIWWCPSVASSLVLLEDGVCYDQVAINPTIEQPELTQDWEIDSWWAQTEPCVHQDSGEWGSDPTKDWPRLAQECPEISSRGVGQWWPAAGLGALSVAVHEWDLLKEVAIIFITSTIIWPQVAQRLKNLPAMRETWVQSLGQEDPLEKEMATHSSILAWRIPWTEEPGGPQSMGSQRVGHD